MMVVVVEAAAAQKQLLTRSCSSKSIWIRWVHTHLLLLLIIWAQTVLGGQIVKYLPGFDGELPFKLETGYVSVDESELFYYFVESEGHPKEDPLFLWLIGGPGCTAFSGLIYEVGPLEFDIDNYTGGLPKLRYYPYARTKAASMIFLDAPVGTGFSYARTPGGWPSSDTKSAEQSYQFLKKWLVEHPQYLSVPLFIGGDSYAGIAVPMITKMIIDGNKDKAEPYINIKGYLLGCPAADADGNENSKVEFAHGMALISDEIYENAKRSCNGNYVNVDPANIACLTALDDVQKCVKDVSVRHILKPNCDFSSSPDHQEGPERRSLKDGASAFPLSPSTAPNPWCINAKRSCNGNYVNVDPANITCLTALDDVQKCVKDVSDRHILKPNCDFSSSPDHQEEPERRSLKDGASAFPLSPSAAPNPWCITFKLTHNNIWANDERVQEALHVRKGAVRHWERCNHSLSFTKNVPNVVSVHKELSRYPLVVLVESGDHDFIIPYVATLKWIKSLNLTIADDWRPWFLDDQVAGYTMKYSEDGYHLTFATLKGAGHPAPEYKRRECYHLFDRWIHYDSI